MASLFEGSEISGDDHFQSTKRGLTRAGFSENGNNIELGFRLATKKGRAWEMKFSRLLRFCAGMSVLQLCLCGNLQSQKAPEGISWNFDESAGEVVHDSLGNLDDRVDGFWSRVPGLPGKALEFDGYSTRIVRIAKNVPPLGDRFSV
jgi:hypothetical protein